MRRYKNIVVLYECNRTTLDPAATLAKENRARLTVAQVVSNPPDKWENVDLGGKTLDLLAKVGIALLLFTVGLKLDLHVVRTMGQRSRRSSVRVFQNGASAADGARSDCCVFCRISCSRRFTAGATLPGGRCTPGCQFIRRSLSTDAGCRTARHGLSSWESTCC